MRSNVEHWQELQARGYFENHPEYGGMREAGGEESLAAIERFLPLRHEMDVVVIGCGYGRETLKIAPHVRIVYGIDVSNIILDKASAFLRSRRVDNFVPVAYAEYKTVVPQSVDLVFSIVVMQHITRDLVRDYFRTFSGRLKAGGGMVVQFLEEQYEGVDKADAQLEAVEPSVSWTRRQLGSLADYAGLELADVHTQQVTPTALWHWTYFIARGHRRAARKPDRTPHSAVPSPAAALNLFPLGETRVTPAGSPEI